MSDPPIRLALVGFPDDIAVWRDVAMRLRGGCFTVVVDSLEAALNERAAEFDAAVICTPLAQRQAAVQLAAEAQKHILLDSPVSESLQVAEATVDACNQAGVCFAVGRTLRFTPSNLMIRERLSNGSLGDPGLLRVHRWRGMNDSAHPGLVERIFPDVDLAICLFGARPTDVYALGRGGDGAAATRDYIQVHFGFPSGGMAIFDFSAALPTGQGYESLSLIGSTGAAYSDDHNNSHLLFRGGDPEALISDQGSGHFVLELQAFVDAVDKQQQPPVNGDEYLALHQVIDAVARSLQYGRVLHEEGGSYV